MKVPKFVPARNALAVLGVSALVLAPLSAIGTANATPVFSQCAPNGCAPEYEVPGDQWCFLEVWDDGSNPPPGWEYFDTGYGRAYVSMWRPNWAGPHLRSEIRGDGRVYVLRVW
jgi:hypothetical protein